MTMYDCYSWWAHGGGKFARTTSTYAISKTEIEFQPSNKKITADVGDRFEDVAKRAGVEIQFKCKKGECGTCEIKVDGKWTRTCQLTVPALSKGETLRVLVPPAKAGAKKPSTFFSPASFLEGVVNNGLGVVGFLNKAMIADTEFDKRMERERQQQERLDARKKLRKSDPSGGTV